jgi:1-acyl-sn-glycerol-3-phosphate acyltransferase
MGIFIIWDYFAWMLPYSRHPERTPLEIRYKKARKLVLRLVRACRIDFHIENQDYVKPGETYFFVGNHLSFFDAIMLVAVNEHPVMFVGKVESRKYPFVGRVFRAISGEFIERDNLKQELKVALKVEASLLKHEYSWYIYPEGTRNKDPYAPMLPFKPGTFRIPLNTKTTIIPFASFGNFRPLSMKINLKRNPIQIRYLKPITYEEIMGHTTIDIAEMVYAKLQPEVDALRTKDVDYVAQITLGKHKSKSPKGKK